MKIPVSELSDEALRGIIEEYVSREGTEYGEREYSLEEKVGQVLKQLDRGEIIVEFDPQSQSCHLIPLGESK